MTSPVIRCADKCRSRDEVMNRAARIGAGLARRGIRPGDMVAIVLRNDIEFVEASLGVAQLGALPIPVNWHWKGGELGYLLTHSGATAAFVHSDLIPTVRDALDRQIPIIEVRPSAALRKAYLIDDDPPAGGDIELESWLAEQTDPLDAPVIPPLGVMYSSGTTGRPKGIRRELMTAEQSAAIRERIFLAFGMRPDMSTLIPAPLYHSAPNAHALFAVTAGNDLTIMPRFSAEDFLATIERQRITHSQVVPTMFVRMLQLPDAQRLDYDVSSLKSVVHAAAPCPPDIKRRMIDWWGPILVEYYGGTETGTVTACTTEEWLAHPGTVGKALPGCDVKILRPGGTEAPTRTSGEVYVDPGAAWPGFTFIGDEARRKAIERDGYVSIGDGGWLDEDGYLYLSDRIADMVIVGGVNIYPVEIEQCLLNLTGVRDAAVFGIPDPVYGETLAAHVDTDPDSGLTEDDLRNHARANLADYKVPKLVVIDRDLPREESGKLFKRRIRNRYRIAQQLEGT
jgi:long-chain acyl-CoA synthetase